jgi:hypothetical protein
MGGALMEIDLEIEGVPNRAIADAIRKTVRNVGRLIRPPDDCRVSIGPSETRGEWDLGIRLPSGWQLVSFSAPLERLPEVIDQALRQRMLPPVEAR